MSLTDFFILKQTIINYLTLNKYKEYLSICLKTILKLFSSINSAYSGLIWFIFNPLIIINNKMRIIKIKEFFIFKQIINHNLNT